MFRRADGDENRRPRSRERSMYVHRRPRPSPTSSLLGPKGGSGSVSGRASRETATETPSASGTRPVTPFSLFVPSRKRYRPLDHGLLFGPEEKLKSYPFMSLGRSSVRRSGGFLGYKRVGFLPNILSGTGVPLSLSSICCPSPISILVCMTCLPDVSSVPRPWVSGSLPGLHTPQRLLRL